MEKARAARRCCRRATIWGRAGKIAAPQGSSRPAPTDAPSGNGNPRPPALPRTLQGFCVQRNRRAGAARGAKADTGTWAECTLPFPRGAFWRNDAGIDHGFSGWDGFTRPQNPAVLLPETCSIRSLCAQVMFRRNALPGSDGPAVRSLQALPGQRPARVVRASLRLPCNRPALLWDSPPVL